MKKNYQDQIKKLIQANIRQEDGILFFFQNYWTLTVRGNVNQISRDKARYFLQNHKPKIFVFVHNATTWNPETKQFEGDINRHIPELVEGLEYQTVEVDDPSTAETMIWLISGGKPFSKELRPVRYTGEQCTSPGTWFVNTPDK